MSDNNNGFVSGLLGGVLGPSDEELDARRKRYCIPAAEPPSAIVSMGRGAMDAWEPVKQMYLNQFQPDQAPAYHAQRQEDERLYQRGLLSANPRQAGARPPGDPWRDAGQVAVAAPLLLPGLMMLPALDGAMSLMLTSNFYAALNDARKRYGLFD